MHANQQLRRYNSTSRPTVLPFMLLNRYFPTNELVSAQTQSNITLMRLRPGHSNNSDTNFVSTSITADRISSILGAVRDVYPLKDLSAQS